MNADVLGAVLSRISEFAGLIVGWVGSFLGSAFAIALISACAGAIAGALGAQRIADRSKRRDELLTELRSTNAAMTVAFSVANTALTLKKQHVQPMHEMFVSDKARFSALIVQRVPSGSLAGREPQFLLDLRRLAFPEFPMETLRSLVFEKISVQGRVLALVSSLGQATSGLRDSLARREKLIQEFADSQGAGSALAYRYFGIQTTSGNTYQEFSDLVDSIHSYTDDIAFFGQLLCSDLERHGERVQAALIKAGRKDAPKVSKVDFTQAHSSGLMPSDSKYSDWASAFHEHEPTDDADRKTGN